MKRCNRSHESEGRCWVDGCQVLCSAKQVPLLDVFRLLLPQSNRSGQRVARREALLYHLVQTPLVNGVRQQLDQPGAKRRQIVGFSTCEELLVDLHLLVHPRPTGIPDISLETGPRCYGPPAEGIGFDQQPGAMTNRRDGLVEFHEFPDELHRILVRAQLVGIGNSAGKHQSVEITGRDIGHLDVHMEPLSLRVVVHRLDLARLVRYQHDVRPRLPQRSPRRGELYLLHSVSGEECDFASLELAGHGDLLLRFASTMMLLFRSGNVPLSEPDNPPDRRRGSDHISTCRSSTFTDMNTCVSGWTRAFALEHCRRACCFRDPAGSASSASLFGSPSVCSAPSPTLRAEHARPAAMSPR